MPKRLIPSAMLCAIMATTACSSSMKTPDIKQNPHPTRHYEVTMTIQGAPGKFKSITANVLLHVKNDECVALTPFSGARVAPEKIIPIRLSQSGNIYQGTFYADQLLDEDYYNLGVCHWDIESVSFNLLSEKASFIASFTGDDVGQGRQVNIYYQVSLFNVARNFPDDGTTSNDPDVVEHPGKYFLTTLVAKEIAP